MRCSVGLPRLLCCVAALSAVTAYVLEGNAYHCAGFGCQDGYGAQDASALQNFTKRQSAGIQGRLLCNGKPFKKAMRLVADVGPPSSDGDKGHWWDGLDENESRDDDAFFRLSGWAPACHGYTLDCHGMEPFFAAFHRCNFDEHRIVGDGDAKQNLTHAYVRRFYIYVPAEYVFDGMVPSKIWDIGTFDLAPYAKHSKDGDVPYWGNTAREIFGGCPWLNCSDPLAVKWPSNKHFTTPTYKCGEEFP
ncbi:TTR-27 protein [Aphelenchoides avenae]|nr:TTR-27 protein [Aphelenchus avenae]